MRCHSIVITLFLLAFVGCDEGPSVPPNGGEPAADSAGLPLSDVTYPQ